MTVNMGDFKVFVFFVCTILTCPAFARPNDDQQFQEEADALDLAVERVQEAQGAVIQI
jgi:hypothetical protein